MSRIFYIYLITLINYIVHLQSWKINETNKMNQAKLDRAKKL